MPNKPKNCVEPVQSGINWLVFIPLAIRILTFIFNLLKANGDNPHKDTDK